MLCFTGPAQHPGLSDQAGMEPRAQSKEGLSPALLCFEPVSPFWLVAACRSKGKFIKVWVKGRESHSV